MGIIYNDTVLEGTGSATLRTVSGRYLTPRTPFSAVFKVRADNSALSILAVHAPPPGAGKNTFFKFPIMYCNQLRAIREVKETANIRVLGDFNCNPASRYKALKGTYGPFLGMSDFATTMPTGSLTSVRKSFAKGQTPPANYLSQYYDNILYKKPSGAAPTQRALDLIGAHPLFSKSPQSARGVLGAYWKVSDHLPVVIET